MRKRGPIVFMSYVHRDNKYNRLIKFHRYFSDELEVQSGEKFPIFMDRNDITWGDNWRGRVERTIDEVTFFIPVITPSYFNSSICREELDQFLERERKLGHKDLILPIYYVDCQLINDKVKRKNNKLAQEIAERQYVDWRPLRLENITSKKCALKLEEMARLICDAYEKKKESGRILYTKIAQKGSILLYDNLEKFSGWVTYLNGKVEQSNTHFYSGKFSLLKNDFNDPNGGFAKLRKKVGLDLLFSGWLYRERPLNSSGEQANRLALENADFNGYGFCINHGAQEIWIEKRDEGTSRMIKESKRACSLPWDAWYQFKFYLRSGGAFSLRLYKKTGELFYSIDNIADKSYQTFDRVVVHGGYPYWVDDLKLEMI